MIICPICRFRRYCEFFAKGERTLLICEACRHLWWDFSPSESELRDYYRNQYTQTHGQEALQTGAREYYRGHLRDLLGLIGKSAQDSQLCDYGCSIPLLLLEAKQAGFQRALGIDYAEEARQHAGDSGIEIMAPEQLHEVADGSLDIVRFSHTLEHCPDPCTVLARVSQKVRPGGLIYITQPNFPVFRCQPSARDIKDSVYPEHLHFFSPISLLEMVRRLDLDVRQFFTHQNEEQVLSSYEGQLDFEYATLKLVRYQSLGDPSAHPLGNYPCYAGENSVLYAFKSPT